MLRPPHSLLEVETKIVGTTVEVVARGEIDIASIPYLAAPLKQAVRERPERLVIDLQQVEFLDSVCIRMLAKTAGLAKSIGVEIVLLPPSGFARRAVDLIGIDYVLGHRDEPAFIEPNAHTEPSLTAVIAEQRKMRRSDLRTAPGSA
jgi:anti-anti-sigma factor